MLARMRIDDGPQLVGLLALTIGLCLAGGSLLYRADYTVASLGVRPA